MKSLIHTFLIILTLSSCVKNVDKSAMTIQTTDEEKKELKQHCDELESRGDIIEHIHDIDLLTGEMLKLLEELRSDDDFSDIINISKQISFLIDSLIAQIDTKFVTPRWKYLVSWKIDRSDFKDLLGSHFKKGFRIAEVVPKGATFRGSQNDVLLKDFAYKKDGNNLVFNYSSIGTSLELCQLNRTKMFLVEVHYKNLVNRNFRRFNLISR